MNGDALLDHIAAILPVEQAVIGAVLYGDCPRLPPLTPSEFCVDRHRIIWQAIVDLAQAGEAVDPVMVSHRLAAAGELERAGGPAAIAFLCGPLIGAIPSSVPSYARRVREASRQRQLRDLGAELASAGLSEPEVAARLKAMPGPLAAEIFDPADVWREVVGAAQGTRLRTGIEAVDRAALGLQPSDFLVIAARTSAGKTSFACQLALAFSSAGHRVDVFALEESRRQILRRMIANRTGIKMRVLRDGLWSEQEFRDAEEAVRILQGLPLSVTDLEHLRSLDEETVLAAVSASDAEVVVLDHLQKVSTRGESRVYGLERVLNGLHAVALRDKKILILTAQLNRGAEHRQGPPMIADCRDTGSIEILARMIWLLYWPHLHDQAKPFREYEVHVAKQGESGRAVAVLDFDAGCGRFS